MSLSPQLSPWDLGTMTFDFGLYRPRRPSYVYATRARRRTSSYRSATRDDESSSQGGKDSESLDGSETKRRKASYKRANKHEDHEDTEVEQIKCHDRRKVTCIGNHLAPPDVDGNHWGLPPSHITIALNDKPIESITTRGSGSFADGDSCFADHDGVPHNMLDIPAPLTPEQRETIKKSRWIYRKNMFIMCISFILVFTVFRSIQNLQSSLNKENNLGIISMCCVYTTMFLTCLLVPIVIIRLGAKWSIVLGLLFYLFWIAANFYPHFTTLIPTSIGVGLGQSLAWTGQVSYLTKLASDYAYTAKDISEYDIYRFNGIFLACFQTTHIWGNLVSSLMLKVVRPNSTIRAVTIKPTTTTNAYSFGQPDNEIADDFFEQDELCGVYTDCIVGTPNLLDAVTKDFQLAQDSVITLMGANIVIAFAGFLLLVLMLDQIDSHINQDKSMTQIVTQNIVQMFSDKTFRLLIPLLIFNGFEQGFLYADFNKSYVTCPLGIEYIGWIMITLGASNVVSSMTVGILATHMPRGIMVGVAGCLHIALSMFMLINVPTYEQKPLIFVQAIMWGICDAVWQTQCNVLITLACPQDHDVAFNNFRLLQAFGAALAFGLGIFLCMATRFYILISLLVCSMGFYAIAEYRINKYLRPETDDLHMDF